MRVVVRTKSTNLRIPVPFSMAAAAIRLLPESVFRDLRKRVPSIDKETHASKRDNFSMFFVILNQRTSSTPQSSVLKMLKFSPLEVEESGRNKFCALQGT